MESVELIPGVELLSSMRSIGYSFVAAVADLIDNSLTANAKNIEIQTDLKNGSYFYVLDDGMGMDKATALEALRLAGTSNRDRSNKNDLGRFGLGLKTASLSQARKVTLVSKQKGTLCGFAWDIDHISQAKRWEILSLTEQEIVHLPGVRELEKKLSGTLIFWQKLDYLIGKTNNPASHLSKKLRELEDHLGFVFHRFLSGKSKTKEISITINGQSVKAIDPFLENDPKTQRTPIDTIEVNGSSIAVQCFTLPHQKYLAGELAQRFDLGKNMRDYQGLYIFRNNRLISWGQWFGLIRKEELYKQSRVSIDIGSELDDLWQIDVRKSRSEPPHEFKERIREILRKMVEKSKRVHTFRGRKASNQDSQCYWIKIKNGKNIYYEINADHPLIKSISASLSADGQKKLKYALKEIVEMAPYNDIYVEKASHPNWGRTLFSDLEYINKIKGLIEMDFLSADLDSIIQKLSTVEPFSLIDSEEKLEYFTREALKSYEH